MPCTDWVEKLTARHPDDLSPADSQALHAHLALCRACNEVYTAYRSLEGGLRRLSRVQSIPVFSYQPLPSRRKRSLSQALLSPHTLFSMIFTLLSSLYLSISWSVPYQKIHTWLLVLFASVPCRIRYLNSDSHFLYAMRSDSGYCLWRQKRYQRHEFVSNSLVYRNALSPIGSGVALAAALTFCRYAVQA